MYQDRLAVAIKVNGKVLREFKDTVYIPFGSEYSILIKNVHSLRCMVRVAVDGQDATEGVSLIVPANSSIELERFIKGGNLNEGNRFKFIERTSKIEEHRGIEAEDGLVRIEYEFEREPAPIKAPDPWHWPYRTYVHHDVWLYNNPTTPSWTITSSGSGSGTITANSVNLSSTGGASYSDTKSTYAEPPRERRLKSNEPRPPFELPGVPTMDSCDIPVNDVGITVPGSVSDQSFHLTSSFLTDGVKHVMVLKLLGQAGEKPVKQAVTVKTTQKCSTCGHVNKATAKFCAECGTSLTIV